MTDHKPKFKQKEAAIILVSHNDQKNYIPRISNKAVETKPRACAAD